MQKLNPGRPDGLPDFFCARNAGNEGNEKNREEYLRQGRNAARKRESRKQGSRIIFAEERKRPDANMHPVRLFIRLIVYMTI